MVFSKVIYDQRIKHINMYRFSPNGSHASECATYRRYVTTWDENELAKVKNLTKCPKSFISLPPYMFRVFCVVDYREHIW